MASVKSFREQYGAELDDTIKAIVTRPDLDAAARQAERERAETDRTAARIRLANVAAEALRGDWGKEAHAAVTRVLAGATPLKAEVAQLVLCESIVKEEQKRRRERRQARAQGRGAK
jgi:phage/plasmid primase-like uncharacterized protein